MMVRNSAEYINWRKSVWFIDNFTCRKCYEHGGSLVAHHINNFADFPELRLNISNGITLCKKCHIHFHKIYGKRNNTREQINLYFNN